jgi:hypothetical protein
MNLDANWLVHDHQRYDKALEDCMEAAEASDWKQAIVLFDKFVEEIKLHMLLEDEVLYPLLKEESGDPNRDLALLGYEHDDLVRLLGDLSHVIKVKDFDHFEESLEPLHKAMVQHNNHEEIVFLSLGSESILMRREEVMQRLEAVNPNASSHRNWNF